MAAMLISGWDSENDIIHLSMVRLPDFLISLGTRLNDIIEDVTKNESILNSNPQMMTYTHIYIYIFPLL